ncbi:MAG TPA: TonB-dependent receptor [Prolixibacteraceae bacterium]|nr:TonB-dependent receptor [Prolixibacteraceae bacterium]
MKTFFVASYVLCLMVFLCQFSSGQEIVGTIYGTTSDKQSQITLPGVTLVVVAANKTYGTTSDTHGKFQFENIPSGRVSIEASSIGYEKEIFSNIVLNSNKNLFINIELLEKIENIDEITITAFTKDKPVNEFTLTSSRTFTVEESNKYAGSWGDPARMVANFAGAITAGDQRNDIIIRGNSPTGLLWKLDGITITNPNHFGNYGSTGGPICILNNNQLSKSDFFTGAFPSEYGNALSGVFDLKMRNGNNQKHEFMGGMGFNGFEFGAEGPISKEKGSSYMVNFRYTMMDLMSAMGMFEVGGVPKYADISLKIHIPTSKAGTFSIIGIGGKSKIDINDDPDNTTSSESGWTSEMLPSTTVQSGSKMGIIGLTNRYFITKNGRIETTISANYSNSFNVVDSLKNKVAFNFYNENFTETIYSISSKYTLKAGAKNTLQAGITGSLYDFNLFDETYITPIDKFIQGINTNGKTMLYEAFFQSKNRLSKTITINWGLHSQFLGLNNSKVIEPRFGISYNINSKHNINLGYGLHGQMQPRLVYFLQTSNNFENEGYILTNKNLDFTKSHHLVAGSNWSISKNLKLKIEAYHQYIYNVPIEKRASTFSMSNYGASFHNECEDSLENSGLGTNKGIELTIEKYLNKNFYFLFTTSIYDAKYRGSDLIWRNNAFNGNHTMNFLCGYELPIKNDALSINIKFVWAGGKRFIPIDLDKSNNIGEVIYDFNNVYTQKYNDYFRTDLRIAYRKNSKKTTQEWSFDIQNLTDHKNMFTQRYDAERKQLINVYQMAFFPIGSWKIYF